MSSLPTSATASLPEPQRRTLAALAAFILEHGYAPSQRDLAERMGVVSTNAVRDQLKALERKGYIRRAPGLPRTITILTPPDGEAVA